MEPDTGGLEIGLKQFLMKSKQFHMELQQIYFDSHLDPHYVPIGRRTDCQAVDFGSQ